jgi:hypothetical protein
MLRRLSLVFFYLGILCSGLRAQNAESISIIVPKALMDSAVTRLAIQDFYALLNQATQQKANAEAEDAQTVIEVLMPSPTDFPAEFKPTYDLIPYPAQSFVWRSKSDGGRRRLTLKAASHQAIAFGLYALLQEKLGFSFVHPRQTVVPNLRVWPLPDAFEFKGAPRFRMRGFHLHTQHPLELTEQLHEGTPEHGLSDLIEYLNWLARNGQNVVQYYMLKNPKGEAWGQTMKAFVDYAHSRGIVCGLKHSFHSIQQRAYQLTPHHKRSLKSLQQQVDKSLAYLYQAPWDYMSPDLSIAEFFRGLGENQNAIVQYTQHAMWQSYHSRFFYNTHVIRNEMTYGSKGSNPHLPELAEEANPNTAPTGPLGVTVTPTPRSGVLLHSVMCYSVTEPKAPVYGNVNQRFMYVMAKAEAARRESWYFPESAYWVSFDNPIPLFIMPYLSARLADIDTLSKVGVTGHVTFSSGWEWGYWSVDWSIARWCWAYQTDLQAQPRSALTPMIQALGADTVTQKGLTAALLLQEYYFKERELLRFLSAANPMDELPERWSKPFQPRPTFRYRWLVTKAPLPFLDSIRNNVLIPLRAYAERMQSVLNNYLLPAAAAPPAPNVNPLSRQLTKEIVIALQISIDRAIHRMLTLNYLIRSRAHKLHAMPPNSHAATDSLLIKAAKVREQSLKLTAEQAKGYRYNVDSLTKPRYSVTAYSFGYLYTAHRLHFWEREEVQARRHRFSPLIRNIWDFGRILGL